MVMIFCPKCKGILIPKSIGERSIIKCKNCDYFVEKKVEHLIEDEKIVHSEPRAKGVVSDENTFATYNHKCKKCGYGKAQVIDVGILYSDEDNLILLQCGKCGYSERTSKNVS